MADEMMVAPTSPADLQRKMQLTGTVKRTELYGAFIDIGVGADAILHVSQLGQNGKRVEDVLKPGDSIQVWVDRIDAKTNQVMVTMLEPLAVEWQDLQEGQSYTGRITRLENFGAFVDIGAEKEGLVHVSEMSHDFIKHPSQAVSVGDEVQVQVLAYSKRKRRINLSMKALLEPPAPKEVTQYVEEVFEASGSHADDYYEEDIEVPTAMEMALRRAMGHSPAPARSYGRQNKKQKVRRQRRDEQNDIIRRTLEIAGR
jgi:ribosomal protein S1